MDHAHDIAYNLQRAYHLHPQNVGDSVSASSGDRARAKFIIVSSEALPFRVTVEALEWSDLTEDELDRDDFRDEESVPST